MAAMILPGAAPAVLRFHRRSNGPFWADWAGTVMEQRGRNRWQTFGSPKGRKWLDVAPNRCHWLPPVAVWFMVSVKRSRKVHQFAQSKSAPLRAVLGAGLDARRA